MAGNGNGNSNSNGRQQKKFSLFGLFKSKKSKRGDADDYVKAYKVYPSDEDRGRWVAEPGIDKKAAAYITLTTNKWEANN